MAKYKVKNTNILHDGVSRGEGSIISGIKSIIERDVMRRTNGGSEVGRFC